MPEYDNTNRGVLFKNDEKKSEKHPDYSGTINVDGVDLKLAGWIKQGKKGKFLSLAVSNENKPKSGIKRSTNVDEDIPFAPIGRVEASAL